MKLKHFFFLIICLGTFIACFQKDYYTNPVLLQQVIKTVEANHLQVRSIDDDLSKDFFQHYLFTIDPEKVFLTQKNINTLKKYELSIDDELKKATFQFYVQAKEMLEKGIENASTTCQAILTEDLDLYKDESFELNGEKRNFSEDNVALKERWRKKLKQELIEKLLIENTNSAAPDFKQKKEKALNEMSAHYKEQFEKRKQQTAQQAFEEYVNTFLKIHDFQSTYLSAKEKEKWEINYTRSFVGIGVSLGIVNQYPVIQNIIIGGPAWKTKQLAEGDIILNVGETNQASVDLYGKDMKEVLNLIKGEQSSILQLTVKTPSNEIKTIAITRDNIDFDLAKSFLLEDKEIKKRIGYIRLPRFYAGNEGCSVHVLKEIETLKANGVEGLILDLRNNKGGSSGEAVELLGYFLKEGVVMQMEYADGNSRVFEDVDGIAQYDGELLVLVNSNSGSASELFAGTMQDYNRAVVVGSPATFGKGTMQRFYNLDTETGSTEEKLGEIKLSIGRFYTASGRSPQYTGIVPDIILPDDDLLVPTGERAHTFVLAPDNLQLKERKQAVNTNPNMDELIEWSNKRVEKNKRFQLAKEKAQTIKEQQENSSINLAYESYKGQKEKELQKNDAYKMIFSEIDGFDVSIPKMATEDSISILKKQPWIQKLESDPYVHECYQIINDMLG